MTTGRINQVAIPFQSRPPKHRPFVCPHQPNQHSTLANMIHHWQQPPSPSRSGPTATPNQPNTQIQPPRGSWRRPHYQCSRDTQPPSSPEGLTPGRCFKDTPSGYTTLRSALKEFRGSSGTTLRPASQISTRPPLSVR